jgi:hypothetical protein
VLAAAEAEAAARALEIQLDTARTEAEALRAALAAALAADERRENADAFGLRHGLTNIDRHVIIIQRI